jgi:hypothetical protein
VNACNWIVAEEQFYYGHEAGSNAVNHELGLVLRLLADDFNVVTMQQHAREVAKTTRCLVVEPNFGSAPVL